MRTPNLRHTVIAAATLLIGAGSAIAGAPTALAAPSVGDQVVALVNKERAAAGCGAVTLDSRLNAAAQQHSADMAKRAFFGHTSPDGVTFAQRAKKAGYPNPAAENIAKGQDDANAVMQSWMNSAGHKANILNCGHKKMGVAQDPNGDYWTQDFGR